MAIIGLEYYNPAMLTIQNVASSVRPVFFRTGLEGFPFATHGGTMSLIEYAGRVYALTCAHVMKDFKPHDLVVAQSQMPQEGTLGTMCKGIYSAVDLGGLSVESEIDDICILDFPETATSAFFGGTAISMNDQNTGGSGPGDDLLVFGVLKDRSELQADNFLIGYGLLDFKDSGLYAADPVLRRADGEWENKSIESLIGLSGAPVFNKTTGKLCGMVSRGTVDGAKAIIRYIDIIHIQAFLVSSAGGAGPIAYQPSETR